MRVTIEDQSFDIVADGERFIIYDSSGAIIGYATDEADATAICEQIAWRRRVDGKVDEKPIEVDEQLTKDAGVDEILCPECKYYVRFVNQLGAMMGLCNRNNPSLTVTMSDHTCSYAERRTVNEN